MYIIGLLFYIGVASMYVLFDSIKNLVYQAVQLAPEISATIGLIALYPLVIFLYHLIFRKREYGYGRYLSSQAKLSASASVSFGLIGTFQGLTEMVSTISHAMGAGSDNSDLVERMNVMINSISSALASMSYAFITSICGVAASVLTLIALNFFISYYKKEEKKQPVVPIGQKDYTEEIKALLNKVGQVEELNVGVAKKLVGLSTIDEDSGKVINLLSDVKGYLNSTLGDISTLTSNQIEIQQAMTATLNEHNRVMQESTGKYLAEMNSIIQDQKQAFELIASSISNVNLTLEKTYAYTQQLPELINRHNKVNEILYDVKNDVIKGLQLLSNDVRLIPDLLHAQNQSTNLLIDVQQGFSNNMLETSGKLQSLIDDVGMIPQLLQEQNEASSQLIEVQRDFSSNIQETSDRLQSLTNDVGVIPDLLHAQNQAANQLVEIQRGLSFDMQQTTAKLQEVVDEQQKTKLSNDKIRKSLQGALEIFAND